jgi:hypothetical protein
MLGRVFAADLGLFTLTLSISAYATGYGLDHSGLGPRVLMGILAASVTLPAAAWAFMRLDVSSQPQGLNPEG